MNWKEDMSDPGCWYADGDFGVYGIIPLYSAALKYHGYQIDLIQDKGASRFIESRRGSLEYCKHVVAEAESAARQLDEETRARDRYYEYHAE